MDPNEEAEFRAKVREEERDKLRKQLQGEKEDTQLMLELQLRLEQTNNAELKRRNEVKNFLL